MKTYTKIKIKHATYLAFLVAVIATPLYLFSLYEARTLKPELWHLASLTVLVIAYYSSIPYLKSVSRPDIDLIATELNIDPSLLDSFYDKNKAHFYGHGIMGSIIYFAKNGHFKDFLRTSSVFFLVEQNKILKG